VIMAIDSYGAPGGSDSEGVRLSRRLKERRPQIWQDEIKWDFFLLTPPPPHTHTHTHTHHKGELIWNLCEIKNITRLKPVY